MSSKLKLIAPLFRRESPRRSCSDIPLRTGWLRRFPTAPPENRQRKSVASSTSTLPFFPFAHFATGDSTAEPIDGHQPLFHKRFGNRAVDFGNFVAGDEAGHVDDMIAPRSPWLPLPATFLSNRQMRGTSGPRPILKIISANVIDAANLSRAGELVLPARRRRRAAIAPPH